MPQDDYHDENREGSIADGVKPALTPPPEPTLHPNLQPRSAHHGNHPGSRQSGAITIAERKKRAAKAAADDIATPWRARPWVSKRISDMGRLQRDPHRAN